LRFPFKINSSYDGFTPSEIPGRVKRRRLELGWRNYIEDVDKGDDVWIYFKGPHKFENGVYVKGRVADLALDRYRVWLHVDEYATDRPLLSDAGDVDAIERVVGVPYRQVFVLPESVKETVDCTLATTGDSCAERRCSDCPVWRALPGIKPADLYWPEGLQDVGCEEFMAGFWSVPRRSIYEGREKTGVRRTSEVFMSFKSGNKKLAYPLALGMREALEREGMAGFDCIVPIPLSPDKEKHGELHRTRALAKELGRLLDTPVSELLSLRGPISKRASGLGRVAFTRRYRELLSVSPRIKRVTKILLVDDTCTHGTTLAAATAEIKEAAPECEVMAATATQMAIADSVARENAVLA
jgi:hypothetical protein